MAYKWHGGPDPNHSGPSVLGAHPPSFKPAFLVVVVYVNVKSMAVSGSPKRWDRRLNNPPIGRKKYHLYTTYSPCLLGGEKCYRSHLLGKPETTIDQTPEAHTSNFASSWRRGRWGTQPNPYIHGPMPWEKNDIFNRSTLSQWLNFKLSGITCLVGKISRLNLFFSGSRTAKWVIFSRSMNGGFLLGN